MQVLIDGLPFQDSQEESFWGPPAWPASWVSVPGGVTLPIVAGYRCRFTVAEPVTQRVHVSADERYELFLDGARIGRGPQRCDPKHWCFETHDLELAAGEHVLFARVWSLGGPGHAPVAQMSVRHGFLLAGEGALGEAISTGRGRWEGRALPGYGHLPARRAHAVGTFAGGFQELVGGELLWDVEAGGGNGFDEVVTIEPARVGGFPYSHAGGMHCLAPARLPAMIEQPRQIGRVRHAQWLGEEAKPGLVEPQKHDAALAARFDALLRGRSGAQVEPGARLRVLIDLDDYYCAYPELQTRGGAGASIRCEFAEALFEDDGTAPGQGIPSKGNRDEVAGKLFDGKGDVFRPDGGEGRVFTPLWWRAGRYVELRIETADQPLVIERFVMRETRYPLEPADLTQTSDAQLDALRPILVRGLQMCTHETYMDCPYYEQLMYIGDTRLEALLTYVLTADDRLPRRALELFDHSRIENGLTQSRYPCGDPQVIPPFSMWWVGMLHDFARWSGDQAFVLERMPCARSIVEAVLSHRNSDGLIEALPGWNFVDWSVGWQTGTSPRSQRGVCGILQWHLVYTLRRKAQLERWLGDEELATRDERLADAVAETTHERFFDASRGLYADDLGHEHFSEHAQVLALLAGGVPAEHEAAVIEGLFAAEDLTRTTIYFSHYLLEVAARYGRADALFKKMEEWQELRALGLKTTVEAPGNTRSDCHAWGAHPLYHLHASVAGVQPAGFGMGRVEVRPLLGPLTSLRTRMPHPQGGFIETDLRRDGDEVTGRITLPQGVEGRAALPGGREVALGAGENEA